MTLSPDPQTANTTPTRQNTLVTIMFFAAGIVFLDRFGITYLFPEIGPELHLNNSQLGALVSVTAITWACSSLLFSALSDRLGGRTKLIIVTCLVTFSIAVGLIGLAPDFETMLLLRAIIGFCEGPVLPLVQGAVARASTPDRRGANLGIVIAGTAVIGSALAPSIMIGLAAAVGWRAAFPLLVLPGVAVAVLVAVFLREDRIEPGDLHRITIGDFRLAVANRNVLLALIGSIVCIGQTIGFGAFAPQFLASSGMAPGTYTVVLTAHGIAGALGAVVGPAVSDRVGRKPALLVAAVCIGLGPLSFVLFTHSVPLLICSFVVMLMGGGALTLITYVVPGESVPPALMATTFALQIAVGETLGGVLGPQLGGAIADATGQLSDAMLFYAAVPVLLIVVAMLITETAPAMTTTKETRA